MRKGSAWNFFILVLALAVPAFQAGAQTLPLAGSLENPVNSRVQLGVGAQGDAWNSYLTLPYQGWEIFTPLTLAVEPWDFVKLTVQTEYANGTYTDSVVTTETLNQSGFSDTVALLSANFKSFDLSSALSLGFNIPTGNSTWETQQSASVIPTEFIESNYRGRGFGISALYALSIPMADSSLGVAGGYMYSNAFNPLVGQGLPNETYQLGDSIFLGLNRYTDYGGGQSDIYRLSGYYFLAARVNGQSAFQLGPNLNASYTWSNPKGFSCEAGVQYFFPPISNDFQSTGSIGAFGGRFYVEPSYTLGVFTLAWEAKYILANGQPNGSLFYDGGGYLLGLEPALHFNLDQVSTFKVTLSLETVDALGQGVDTSGERVDVQYLYGALGTEYEVHL